MFTAQSVLLCAYALMRYPKLGRVHGGLDVQYERLRGPLPRDFLPFCSDRPLPLAGI